MFDNEQMLTSSDRLPAIPARVAIAGASGVGKTTLARRIGETLGLPYTEIDALYHGPNWVPRQGFLADVDVFTREPTWVTEWQYNLARPMIAERADLLVWLDLPAPVAVTRVVLRTVRRSRSREELWNGNVEPGIWHALTAREGIIRWALSTGRRYTRSVPAVELEHPALTVVRLRSQAEVESWLSGLRAEA
jgi:hypothetical protein